MEFLASHSAVIFQPPFDHPGYRGINPYALGFAIFSDLKRLCEAPTAKTASGFPTSPAATGSRSCTTPCAITRTRASSCSSCRPKVMRDLRLFGIVDDDADDAIEVTAIHDHQGYRRVREQLASQYNLGDREPNIQITRVDLRGDRSLTLRHAQHQRRTLGGSTGEVLKHLHRLWGFPVRLESVHNDEVVARAACPPEAVPA
jgi:stage V sporulation protein R